MRRLILIVGLVCCSISCTERVKNENIIHSDYVPKDYVMVWNDEFNSTAKVLPDTNLWYYETGGGGWGNNELQYYLPACNETDTVAYLKDGSLFIRAVKFNEPIDGYAYGSARMNTKQAWKYGYFEGRMKLPKGVGTWPAFWMLPKDFKKWPLEGEMDIMEHVGSHPDTVHITMHMEAYNHTRDTQKTSVNMIPNVQDEFHLYALEWTDDSIKGFIDGRHLFSFENDKQGNLETWPFNVPFLIKLNMAIGGTMGGSKGVDDSCFPTEFEIDYIRVYQKK